MYGINWVTVLGKVVCDPITVHHGPHEGLAFRIDSSFGKQDLLVWCYSFTTGLNVTKTFDVKRGQFVVFHGSLFSPTRDLFDQVDEYNWSLAVMGRVYVGIAGGEPTGDKENRHIAPCVITGMVAPGIGRAKSKNGNEWINFTLHNETEMPWRRGVARNEQTVSCTGQLFWHMEKAIVPGSVVLCRGKLDMSIHRRLRVHCLQIESLGVVQHKLLNRYKTLGATFPPGFDPVKEAHGELVDGSRSLTRGEEYLSHS